MENRTPPSKKDAGGKDRGKGPRFSGGDLMDILEVSSDLICVCHSGCITAINSAGAGILGAHDKEQVIGRQFTDFIASDYLEAIEDFLEVVVLETTPFPVKMIGFGEAEIGAEINVHRATELGSDAVVILVHDVTNHVRMSEAIHRSEARYRKLVHSALNLICVCQDDKVVFINDSGAALLKAASTERIVGRPFVELLHPDYQEILADGIGEVIQENALLPAKLKALDGSLIDAEMVITSFDGAVGSSYVVEARDITDHNQAVAALFKSIHTLEERVAERTRELTEEMAVRRQAEEKLRHMASHDVLTGLPNRALLMDRMTVSLARARRYHTKAALMFVDLDGFKPVNDTLGHETGDILLKQIAKKLMSCERESDTAARIGGDEFVLLLSDISDREAVAAVAKKILTSLSEPTIINGEEVTVGASIGISLFPDDGETAEHLLKEADKAMYAVKKSGRNNYLFAS